jgi:hypothetical protein
MDSGSGLGTFVHLRGDEVVLVLLSSIHRHHGPICGHRLHDHKKAPESTTSTASS